WPIFCGSSSLPLKRKTVLRAITFMSGKCERVPIRLSVKPSLRYSLLGSEVAFTNGSTAMDEIFPPSDLLRARYIQATAKRTTTSAAKPAMTYLREPTAEVAKPEPLAAGVTEEVAAADAAAAVVATEEALASVATLPDRPVSKSRFSRARSA